MLIKDLARPARRHLCEECSEVFECHLCTIKHTHELHNNDTEDPKIPIYICLACAERNGVNYVATSSAEDRPSTIYCYTTGKIIKRDWDVIRRKRVSLMSIF